MSVYPSCPDRSDRRALWLAAPVALLLAASAMPARAQSRLEIHRRSAGAESDSTERQLRRLQRQLDSLARLFNVGDELSVVDRRRIEADLARTMSRMDEMVARLSAASGDRLIRLRGGIAPIGSERSAGAMSRALLQVEEAQAAMPRGWMGLVVEGSGFLPRIENGELIVRYVTYPEIVSVDPSSPAERAGLAPRDTLLSYDGRDVRENDISFTRLLRPNARVVVRVRRDGRARDVPVTVAAAPQRIVVRRDEEVRGKEPWMISRLPDAPSFPRSPVPPPRASGTMRASVRQAPGAPGMPPASAGGVAPTAPTRTGFMFGFGNTGVAGASLTTITEGLGRAVGVLSGVLVTTVPVGSPAHESGLEDGDVITRVAGQAVRSVAQVRQLVGHAWESGARGVELEIVRQKKTQKASLKW